MDCFGHDPDWLLGGFCILSASATRLQLLTGWRAQRLAAFDDRVSGALEQEQQSRMGIRYLVPESFPARKTFRIQWRWVCHAQFHSDSRHDDSGTDRRRNLAQSEIAELKS